MNTLLITILGGIVLFLFTAFSIFTLLILSTNIEKPKTLGGLSLLFTITIMLLKYL